MKALEYISYKEYLKTDHWKRVRWAALWHAGFKCQVCGDEDDLTVHHRSYENLGDEKVDDLTILCKSCHSLYEMNKILPALPEGAI